MFRHETVLGYRRNAAPALQVYPIARPINLSKQATLSPVNAGVVSSSNLDDKEDSEPAIWSSPAWPAGCGLSQLLLGSLSASPSDERRIRVLEIGAGTGATSLAAALCGADVLSTDCEAEAVKFIGQTAVLNAAAIADVGGRLRAALFDVMGGLEAITSLLSSFDPDVVIAADVLFSCELRETVPWVLRQLFEIKPALLCIVAEPDRRGAINALLNAFPCLGVAAATNLEYDRDAHRQQSWHARVHLPLYFDVFECNPLQGDEYGMVESLTRFVVICDRQLYESSSDSATVPRAVLRLYSSMSFAPGESPPYGLRRLPRSELAIVDVVAPEAPPPPPPCTPLRPGRSSKIEVRYTGHERREQSWFASADIAEGEVLCTPSPSLSKHIYERSAIMAWPAARRHMFCKYSYQIDDDLYFSYCSDTMFSNAINTTHCAYPEYGWFSNHSCDPNVWFLDNEVVCARRDIKCGEELLYDFATTRTDEKTEMVCDCGTGWCRGQVRGDDWARPELQFLYGNHFLPYILQKIKAQRRQLLEQQRLHDAATRGSNAP